MAFDLTGHGLLSVDAARLSEAMLDEHVALAADLLGFTAQEAAIKGGSQHASALRALAMQVNLQVSASAAPEAMLLERQKVGDIELHFREGGAVPVHPLAQQIAGDVLAALSPGTSLGKFETLRSRR